MRKFAKAPGSLELFPALDDEPAVRILVHPIGIKAVRAARRAVAKALSIDPEDVEEAGDELSRELLRRGVYGWTGIGDDQDQPLEFSPEALEEFIADPDYFEAADREYVLPWVKRHQLGKGSPLSRAGTGAAAMQASGTVRSPARPKRTGGAKRAPTSRKNRQPTTA